MTILRAGLYERVSTEEQSKFGFSIADQEESLIEYCEKNQLKIVDHYKDEGISGAKPPMKRPALQRLIEDVQAGKIDIILFTRLDRWFRSVKEYFKVQEILDKHGVQWKAIRENYDTTTANGQMAITIFLAVAQNERDKGAERVKAVLKSKRKNKEACFGGPYKPMGYMKQEDENGVMRLVKDPAEEQMVQDFWNILIKHNNLVKAIRHMYEVYGISKSDKAWTNMARSPFYCGMYDDIEDFCPAYVSVEDWLTFQEGAERRRQDTRAKRTYLFSGMIRCPNCDHMLCGTYRVDNKTAAKKEYLSYRCRFKWVTCSYKHSPTELKIEKYLLKNLRPLMEKEIHEHELEKAKPKKKPRSKLPALKEQLRRLNVMYMAGNITDEDYLKDDAELKAKIAQEESKLPPPERDTTALQELLKTDFENVYKTLDREEKRRFWRGIIKQIKFDGRDIVDVDFL